MQQSVGAELFRFSESSTACAVIASHAGDHRNFVPDAPDRIVDDAEMLPRR